MTDFIDMTLKILYTLDDGSNTSNNVSYLARSKKPQRVRVANIPNPNDFYSNNNIGSNKTSNNNNNNIHNHISSNVDENNNNNINDIGNKFNGLNNNDCGIHLKVGLVNLSTVLKEIYLNSPEVLQINNNNNNNHNTHTNSDNDVRIDYNVYYRDICEVNEPLVSLGLLSDIQSKLNKINNNNNNNERMNKNGDNNNNDDIDMEEDEDEDEEYVKYNEDEDEDEDDLIVTGRVCSNFSALLRRSYSNSHKNMNSISNNKKTSKRDVCKDTLEIKLKFSKILLFKEPTLIPKTSNVARRQNTMIISPFPTASPNATNTSSTTASETTLTPQYSVPSLPKKINKITKPKRQTNPMPAPKAKRTQSLPLWSLNASGTGLRNGKNSIAHKIFMADRLMEENNSNPSSLSSNYPKQQMFTYEINRLQNDNTIQRNIVDDSISKRFDFMNKKLSNSNSNGSSPLNLGRVISKQTSTKNKKGKTTRKSKTKSKSDNTTTAKNKRRSQPQSRNVPVLIKDPFVNVDSNKENIPPLNNDEDDENNAAPLAERMDTRLIDPIHTDQLDLEALNFNENALNWFEDITKDQPNNKETMTSAFMFDNDNIKLNDILLENNSKDHINNNVTPRDILDDPDRTSPLDTLSMPLMELEQDPSSLTNLSSEHGLVHGHHDRESVARGRRRITTCQEQLNRLPILPPAQPNLSQRNSNNKNPKTNKNDMNDTPIETNHMEDIVGSEATILLNYNTSPINALPNDNSSRSNLRNLYQYNNNNNNNGNNERFDDEEKKRQKILPSSPGMIFDYGSVSLQPDDNDEDSVNMTPDLFTKFLDQNHDDVDNANRRNQSDILINSDDKIDSDFNEMRSSNNDIYTPATTVHFTSDEK